jgi:two-component system, NtrC family, sensor kinase
MLNRWRRLSLQVKITVVITIIVIIFAGLTELIEPFLIQDTMENKVVDVARAVAQSVDQNVTSLAHLSDRESRMKELDKMMVTLPDLITIMLYAFSTKPGLDPLPVASVGFVELSRREWRQDFIQRVIKERRLLIDDTNRTRNHHVFMAAPVYVNDAVVGATYAEFSTQQMDEVVESLRRVSRIRRLVTWLTVIIAINLFLYFKVHRPLQRVRIAIEAASGGALTETVPVEDQDELGELTSTFNDMMKKIREKTEDNAMLTESLRAMNDSLQAKVREATAEVLEKNRVLAHTNELLSAAQRDAARAQRLSAIGQVAATVAHKIGTPLTALSGHVQLMAEDPTLGRETRQRLQTVEIQIERTSKIIQDLLMYARKPDPVRSSIDLNACVEECLFLFQPELERRRIALITEWSQGIGKIQADAQQLQEVFHSLIENALDAMSDGGRLVVRVVPHSALDEPDHRTWATVEFIDTGCGMTASQLEQIFQPFFTTKRAGRGTGLGLASALETIRAHGGDIKVLSEPGKGSRFTVVLPPDGG